MTTYSASFRGVADSQQSLAPVQPIATIVGAATQKVTVLEVGLTFTANGSGSYGLGRPAANGSGVKESYAFVGQQDDGAPVGIATFVAAWTTPPTAPTQFLRRFTPVAAISGAFWSFARGLTLPASGQLVLMQLNAFTPVADIWAVIDE